MAKLTRGVFIKKTSAGAAALGALAAAPGLAALPAGPEAEAAGASVAGLHGSVVAHVRNAATGELALLVGTREIIVRDRALARRLVNAAR